jgi:hypothetical protein
MLVKLRKTVEILYDALFPPSCLNCNKSGKYICEDCELFLIEAESIFANHNIAKPNISTNEKRMSFNLISAWEKNNFTDRIITKIYQNQATHLLKELVQRALIIFLNNKNLDKFWTTWFDSNTEIIVSSSPEESLNHSHFSDSMVKELISLTDRSHNIHSMLSPKNAIVISLSFHNHMEHILGKLKRHGFDNVWALVLVR